MKADNIVAADRWTTLFDRERYREHIRAVPIEKQKHRRFIPKTKLTQNNLIQAWTRPKNRRKNKAYKQQSAMMAFRIKLFLIDLSESTASVRRIIACSVP